MVWLPNGEKILKMCLFVLTWSTTVTDGRTDRHRPGLCIASRGKNHAHTFKWHHFQWPWVMTSNPDFKMMPLFDAESQKWYEIQTSLQWNINRDLHTPYWRLSFRMTLSDLAKFSMTRSIMRASCSLSATAELLVTMEFWHANQSEMNSHYEQSFTELQSLSMSYDTAASQHSQLDSFVALSSLWLHRTLYIDQSVASYVRFWWPGSGSDPVVP